MTKVKVEVIDVWKNFGKINALQGVSLKVLQGEAYAIMGPNGSGKSTLASIIAGVLKPSKGSVLIDNQNPWLNKDSVSYLPQKQSALYYLTAEENLHFYGRIYMLSKPEIKERAQVLLNKLGLKEHSKRLVRDYSGGMIRKLEIAIALLPNPQLLILDEPTHGLDPAARLELREIIKGLVKEDYTLILATHIADDAEALADRVAFINNGKLAKEAPIKELKTKCGTNAVIEVRTLKNSNVKEMLKLYSKGGLVIETELGYKIYPLDEVKDLRASVSKKITQIYDVVPIPPTLEDVFLIVVGTSLRSSNLS